MLQTFKPITSAILTLFLLLFLATATYADHTEADGLILRMDGVDIVTIDEGVVSGELEVHHGEHTGTIEVFFTDHDGDLFQPDEPEFSLGAVIADASVAGFEELSQWTFRLQGIEEGMTDLTLSILHNGHSDFTAPAIEVHVEEEHGHAEADGLILRMDGVDIVTIDEGVVSGELIVPSNLNTGTIEVFFTDHDGDLFQPDEPEFSLGAVIADASVAGFEELSQWTFRLQGIEEGMTDLTLSILHNGHSDFTAPAIAVQVMGVSDVPGSEPLAFNLKPNYPNPFNPSTDIRFELPENLDVSVSVYDVSGRLVRCLLVNESRSAGDQTVTWDGRDDQGRSVVSGVYFYRVDAGSFLGIDKMTLLK